MYIHTPSYSQHHTTYLANTTLILLSSFFTHTHTHTVLKRPIFCGKTEADQLELIFRTLGTPSLSIWPSLSQLPYYDRLFHKIPQFTTSLQESPYRKQISTEALGLLDRLLVMDPTKRISAHAALNSKYFLTRPYAPADPTELPKLDLAPGINLHEYVLLCVCLCVCVYQS